MNSTGTARRFNVFTRDLAKLSKKTGDRYSLHRGRCDLQRP